MSDIYKTAAQAGIRFTTGRGEYTTEDLFSLSLKDLDSMAVNVNRQLKNGDGETFLENPDPKKRKETAVNQLRLDILKDVIQTKQEENRVKTEKAKAAAQRNFLLQLRDKKRLDKMEGLSLEEIEAQLAAQTSDEE